MTTLLVGEFTFLDLENDGRYEAIIHRIDRCLQCESIDDAEDLGESLLSDYESYLVPESYRGFINLKEMESVG
ncbi:MAG: hypothetical protein HRU18_03830 [Pseudoalteromonas sp.]|uniref:hypothetical protein n=1 Tax=Pseudoalteromonas sp. TaxID=53249 RepID=UPI001DCA8E22|nr:hypothetical protein [Pseudoalteromonas sp.]NRA77317.1 hypothetical protein [Pseudoalteromonas sp.]